MWEVKPMKTMRLTITGMHCDGCVASLRAALDRTAGVTSTDVRLNEAVVSFDEAVCGATEVFAAVRGAGAFDVAAFATDER